MIGIIAILLFGLFGLMFCVGCAGCLRPQWAKVKTRKEAAQMAGTAFVLALIVSPFLPDDKPKTEEQQTTAKDEQEEAQHTTEENFLERAKREALANYGTATPEERRVRKVMENYLGHHYYGNRYLYQATRNVLPRLSLIHI